jgi:hypothetical protein
MNYLSVDGVELIVPMEPETTFQTLIQYLRESLITERALISSVKVDGIEVTGQYEQQIGTTPISALKSIEISTSHPRELADDTLQHLMEYSLILENLSRSSSELIQDIRFHSSFARLLEGISTFTEAVSHVKVLMKIGLLQPIDLLEADLLSILKDLLNGQQQGQTEYVVSLLKEHLPTNLKQWRESGIPILIRARDS